MDAVLVLENFFKIFFKKEQILDFEDKLFLNGSKMHNFKFFLQYSVIEGVLCLTLSMIIFWNIFNNKIYLTVIAGSCLFFAPLLINYIYQDLRFEKRKRQKEGLLCDMLLEASVFCDDSSVEKTINRISCQDFLLIKDDFQRAHTQIINGGSVSEALTKIKELNKSSAYSRVIDLMIQGYKSGAKTSSIFRETAQDLLESKAILAERGAVMLVTKYTLILSAGIIVPAILGLIIGLVSGLNFSGMGELSIGLGEEERKALFDTSVFASAAYIFEYAFLSSFFLAQQEGNKKNFFIYALILVPLAGGIFFGAKTIL